MNRFTKILALVLSVFLIASVALTTASAATYRSGANAISTSYKNGPYYSNFVDIPLTGDGRLDVVAVALSQLGYEESSSINDLSGLNGSNGYNMTEYNYNMGDFGSGYGYYWCATFVSWALYQSRCTDQIGYKNWTRNHTSDSSYIWCEVSCSQWAAQLRRYGYWKNSPYQGGAAYTPQSGDLIFFTWDGKANSEDHIGIVVYSDGSKVYTVEGNTSDASGLDANGGGVYYKSYSLSASTIAGYGVMPYKTVASEKRIDYSGANPTTGIYMATQLKNIYQNEDDTDYKWRMARFTQFEVIGVAANGRLKAICTTTDGQTVTGYVKNNTDRVIQLTVTNRESDAKIALRGLIQQADGIDYTNYSPDAMNTFYAAYKNAKTIFDSASSTDADYTSAYNALNAALNNTVVILSTGKSYTSSTQVRTDAWADDGIVLTDGQKGNPNGATTGYAGWQKKNNVVIDLGSKVESNTYTLYFAGGVWHTNLPKKDYYYMEIFGSDSATGSFTSLGVAKDVELKTGPDAIGSEWSTYVLTLKLNSNVNYRYIKFAIVNEECVGHIWIDEVEVSRGGVPANGIYLNRINCFVEYGAGTVFTPSFGEILGDTANHRWTANVVAKWNPEKSVYVVTASTVGSGASTPNITLASDEILVTAHEWEGSDIDNPVAGSAANKQALMATKVGQEFRIYGVDLVNNIVYPGAFMEFVSEEYEMRTDIHHYTNNSATCTNDQKCSACGVLITPALGHDDGEWETLEDGSQVCSCTRCGEVIDTKEAIAKGDINFDGMIDLFDYLLIKSIHFGNITPSDDQFSAADVNDDGIVDIFDYMYVRILC